MIKRLFVFCVAVTFFTVLPMRLPCALWAISDEDLLKKADSLASYYGVDFSAEYTIVQNKPSQNLNTTVARVFRRDSDEMYTIIVIKPAMNKGQGYLKQGDTLWFYDPESKRFNSTSSRDRFQNSNARNSDFTRSTLAQDYKISAGEEAVLGRFKCRVLTLLAATNEVSYPRMKVWISDDGLVRKTEDYSMSGQLLRTSAIPDYYKIGERYVPKAILLVDALRGATVDGVFVNEKTQISISKPSFAPVPGSVFSKTYLEKAAR
ncbi:MAG: outer membrane lipoprotein-sorting protein [Spirochaetaceae bacterium]|jgi:outer membrane lipoprotein-sorting protein|nr:outer membrane lipoprotein-sorting protein [Spirochaetaceae bacterium]